MKSKFSFKIFLSVTLFFSIIINAQDFRGIHSSNFFSLQNINNQPADLVRSENRWQINLFSTDLYLSQDFILGDNNYFDTLLRGNWDNLNYFFNAEKLELFLVGKAILPSVSYKISAKHALALSVNLPAQGVYRTSNSKLFQLFQGIENPEELEDLQDEFFKGVVNQLTEFTLTWSGVIWQNKGHSLTAGVNLNYLVGGGAGYFDLDGIDLKFGQDNIDFFDVEVSYAINENLGKTISSGSFDLFGDRGFGMDLGLTYSYLPKDRLDIPYRFKIGFVANNLGHVKHSSNVESGTFRVTANDIPYSTFEDINSIPELIDTLKDLVDFNETKNDSFSMNLPSTYAMYGDLCLKNNWYLASYLSYLPNHFTNVRNISNRDHWSFGLTPRFENKNWGVFLPLFYNTPDNSVGLAFKYKFFFLGSSSIIGNLFSKENANTSLYFGFNIAL